MSWRYTVLSMLILLSFGALRVPPLFTPPLRVDPSWLIPPSHEEPEGRLAMGHDLAFQCADVWSLELIKGVSDTIAFELLDKRLTIIRAAYNGTPLEAIQKARGIGEKTGERILSYLNLTEGCERHERFEVWRDRP
ncbi:MAG: hypothetical protein RIS36_99 [Pseudomonadota bacterium]|jgi:hypothetical protein